jgi:hypothetical protein
MSGQGESGAASRSLSVEELERWVLFGATWRLVQTTEGCAIVDLCQCTGELVERRVASDPAVLEYLRHASRPVAE